MHQLHSLPPQTFHTAAPSFSPGPMNGGFQQMMIMSQLMQVMMTMMQSLMGMAGEMNGLPSQPHWGGPQSGANSGLGNFLGHGMPGATGLGHGVQGASSPGHGMPGATGNGNSHAVGSHQGSGTSAAGVSSSAGVKNPVNLSRAQAEDLVRKGGGKVNPGGRPTVLALRSETSASRTYKDTFIVLKADGSMQPFDGNTRPSRSGHDKAMLKPGAYEMSPRWRDGKFNNDAFVVKSANGSMNVGVGRDSNGDGVYSQEEMNRNTSSSLIRFHRGRGDRTSSSGCINCKDYDGFLKAVGGRDAKFNFVLVNQ